MILKFCYKNEIHRVSRPPSNFNAIIDAVKTYFGDILPKYWSLQYIDADGDRVMLCTEDDYAGLMQLGERSIKIYVIDLEENGLLNSHSSTREGFIELVGMMEAKKKMGLKEEMKDVELKTSKDDAVLEAGDKDDSFTTLKNNVKEYIENNISSIAGLISQRIKTLHEKEAKLVSEMLKIFNNLDENKKKEINELFEGIPEKLLRLKKKDVKKAQSHGQMLTPRDIPESSMDQQKEKSQQVPKKPIKYEVSVVKESSNCIAKPSVKDVVIYRTLVIKNSGDVEWPKNCFLRAINPEVIMGQDITLIPLAPQKEFSVVLIFKNPGKAGKYTSCWKLFYYDQNNNLASFDEQIEIMIEILDANEKEPEKPTPVEKKTYSKAVIEKAKAMKEIFPEDSLETLLNFVDQVPNLPLDVLIENYLMN